jgi:tRNA G18 (ribose-2'-O)-methylase SpoU
MPTIVNIADIADPRIEAYRNIQERDLVGRQARFIAEGAVVVEHLCSPKSLFKLESVLLEARRLEGMRPALERLSSDVPVYILDQRHLDAVAGFHLHRGILGIGLRGEPRDAGALLAQTDLAVCVEGIANHDNIGGIFRNAAAFGAGAVLYDETSCDPLYRKAIRVSVGASLLVPFANAGTTQVMLDALERHDFATLALTPHAAAEDLEVVATSLREKRVALLLGSEEPGLSALALRRARPVRIAMQSGFDSLNVAVASGIALHRVMEARRPPWHRLP